MEGPAFPTFITQCEDKIKQKERRLASLFAVGVGRFFSLLFSLV
jgi:hypothetical protein